MINILEDYISRSIPLWEDFSTNPNLRKKVGEDGSLLPYVGNTVVFLLDGQTKHMLAGLREELYQTAGSLLAQPLDESTFHMTLHDLANGLPGAPGLEEWMHRTEEGARAVLRRWQELPTIRMEATWLFNMVNTSIVLGLRPADTQSWQLLDEMYHALEDVARLGYALTPHITMAYFRPGTYSPEQLRPLVQALRSVELEVELRPQNLVLQSFSDMNHYETIQ